MNNRLISIYDPGTGQVLCVTSVREGDEDAACGGDRAWIDGRVDSDSQRIDLVTLEPVDLHVFEPDLSAPNTVGNLPEGTTAHFAGIKAAIDDGSLEIEVTWAETVRVMLIHPLYFPLTVEIDCA